MFTGPSFVIIRRMSDPFPHYDPKKDGIFKDRLYGSLFLFSLCLFGSETTYSLGYRLLTPIYQHSLSCLFTCHLCSTVISYSDYKN